MPELCAVTAREMVQLQSQVESLEDASAGNHQAQRLPDQGRPQDAAGFRPGDPDPQRADRFFERLEKQAAETGQADLTLASEAITLRKLKDRLRTVSSPLAE